MKTINLIFGCHSHQPVGNFDFVFEEAYEKSYRPFIDVLERFPLVRVTLHYTGPLWDWFVTHKPEYIVRLRKLVETGQVEIMGGAYYEPLLCAIPERDAIAQIHRMQDFCQHHFGEVPRGMWLAERVWEPHMARILSRAGVGYTALDDAHFLCSGISEDDVYGYYMTEDEGHTVKVFPILERLRYTIPFQPVEDTIEYLRERATEDGTRCAVIHDDGEKFGVWPYTYQSVYEEGWLEAFFAAITENHEWLHSVTYKDYIEKNHSLGRTYLTCASYDEMMGWALPARMQHQLHDIQEELKHDPDKFRRYRQFIRGGFWRSFLAKYPESNNLQKRMLRVSGRLEALRQKGTPAEALQEAEQFLHQGQCNCAYWHGVFGGLYLNHLRTAIYENVIAAENALDKVEGCWPGAVAVSVRDFDGDDDPEVMLSSETLEVFCDPTDGGTLFELDHKPSCFNLFNTLTRVEEAYHRQLLEAPAHHEGGETSRSIHDIVHAKEENLGQFLVYDRYRRASLRDHFLPQDLTVDQLWANTYQELGPHTTARYAFEPEEAGIRLSCEAPVQVKGEPLVRITKVLTLEQDASSLKIRYHIENLGEGALESVFGVEWVVNFLTGSAPDRYYWSRDRELDSPTLGKRSAWEDLNHLALRDEWKALDFELKANASAMVYAFPVETVSQSEGGQERVYQGSVVIPTWPVSCKPGESFSVELDMTVSPL
jgi:alpha-amylase